MQTSKRDPFRKPGVADEIEAQLRMQEERRIEAARLAKAESEITRLGRLVRWGIFASGALAVIISLAAIAYLTDTLPIPPAATVPIPEKPQPTASPQLSKEPELAAQPEQASRLTSTPALSTSTPARIASTPVRVAPYRPPPPATMRAGDRSTPSSSSPDVGAQISPQASFGTRQAAPVVPEASNSVTAPQFQWTGPISSEYAVKATLLLNLPQYVKWPRLDQSFTFGILGEDPFSEGLWKSVQDGGGERGPFAKRSLNANDLLDAQIVFISKSEGQNLPAILNAFAGTSVLTVGESEGFARQGGVIGFVLQGDQVRFEINTGAARRAGLKLDLRLLKLAVRVFD